MENKEFNKKYQIARDLMPFTLESDFRTANETVRSLLKHADNENRLQKLLTISPLGTARRRSVQSKIDLEEVQ